MSTNLENFLALVRNDAAVQELVVAASKAEQPVDAILAVAAQAGFQLTADDVKSVFNPELGHAELDRVAGGLASPQEMFAEYRSNKPR
jgi:predicted ribosomally synthesized peptide with nif11-like leader